jgi:hypothetical protein
MACLKTLAQQLRFVYSLYEGLFEKIYQKMQQSHHAREKMVGHMAQLCTPIAFFSRWGGKASGQADVQHIKEVVVAKASRRVGYKM